MGKWTANLLPGVLKRSEGYKDFLIKDGQARQDRIKRLNWKTEQIARLKKQRAIAARTQALEQT